MSLWSKTYTKLNGTGIVYHPIGSAAGVSEIVSSTTDFGASDAPLKPEELAANGLAQFPIVISGVVPVVNLDGVEPGQLRFTGQLLADIYLGKIAKWNDPAIRALNVGANLPDRPINVIFRSDGSGTTYNWVSYLSKVSPEWKTKVGASMSVRWPTGVGANGNGGVADAVARVKGSIGYVQESYVLNKRMTYALVQNRAGNFIAPSAAGFQAAAESADWRTTQDFYLVMTDAPGAQAYPITATSFVLMHKQPKNAARAHDLLAFFRWALELGQEQASSIGYVPLPSPLVRQIETYWEAEIR
jgi:phosphate transport system substrate-binding protein